MKHCQGQPGIHFYCHLGCWKSRICSWALPDLFWTYVCVNGYLWSMLMKQSHFLGSGHPYWVESSWWKAYLSYRKCLCFSSILSCMWKFTLTRNNHLWMTNHEHGIGQLNQFCLRFTNGWSGINFTDNSCLKSQSLKYILYGFRK